MKTLTGFPIFVLYHVDNREYYGLLARTELYLEQKLEKKSLIKSSVFQSKDNISADTQNLLKQFVLGKQKMFQKGLLKSSETHAKKDMINMRSIAIQSLSTEELLKQIAIQKQILIRRGKIKSHDNSHIQNMNVNFK